jgi:hypothetical protein
LPRETGQVLNITSVFGDLCVHMLLTIAFLLVIQAASSILYFILKRSLLPVNWKKFPLNYFKLTFYLPIKYTKTLFDPLMIALDSIRSLIITFTLNYFIDSVTSVFQLAFTYAYDSGMSRTCWHGSQYSQQVVIWCHAITSNSRLNLWGTVIINEKEKDTKTRLLAKHNRCSETKNGERMHTCGTQHSEWNSGVFDLWWENGSQLGQSSVQSEIFIQ